jgi:hypothetical protein
LFSIISACETCRALSQLHTFVPHRQPAIGIIEHGDTIEQARRWEPDYHVENFIEQHRRKQPTRLIGRFPSTAY